MRCISFNHWSCRGTRVGAGLREICLRRNTLLMNHTSEVVVITGASAGVGRATVREFARHGARIALLARGIDGLEAARKEVEELGGTPLVLPVDVADANQVEEAAARIETDLGQID